MILEHHTTRLLADHGDAWTATLGQAAARLTRRPAIPQPGDAGTSSKHRKTKMSVNSSQSIVRTAIGALGMAVCAGLVLAGAVSAGPVETDVRTAAVRYADLDLSSSKGRAALDRRIQAAARAVCDIGFFYSADRWRRIAEQRCYFNAVERARLSAAAAGRAPVPALGVVVGVEGR